MRDSEIGEERVVVREENVLGLHIAVHVSVAVRVVESSADFVDDAQRLVDRKLVLPVQPVAQGAAGDIRRHVVEGAVRFTRVDERNDVRMGQLGGDADLAKEALGAYRSGEFMLQDLDRNLALVLPLLGQVHGRHTTLAEYALDRVAIGERAGERGLRVAHARNIARA